MDDHSFECWAETKRPPPGLQIGPATSFWPFLRRYVWRPIRRRLFDTAIWLVGEYQSGIDQALDIRITDITVPVPGLDPRLDGFSILQVSDLHVGAMPGILESALAALDGASVDLLVFTGDYAPKYIAPPEDVIPPLRGLIAAVESHAGTFAILGNYDSAALARQLRAEPGCTLLINETVELQHAGATVSITGTDDPYDQPNEPIAHALATRGPGFSIALVHTPDLAAEAAAAGHDLYLCGHTHGGQICLPNNRPLLTNCRKRRDLAYGLWREGNMWGYTTRGVGVSGIARRHNCPPEIPRITLLAVNPIAGDQESTG